MSPRRSRRRVEGAPARDTPRAYGLDERVEWGADEYLVRRLTGAAATKAYRCPGCDQEIRPGVPHVVVWSAYDPDAGGRRHWHATCWQARDRRRPRH